MMNDKEVTNMPHLTTDDNDHQLNPADQAIDLPQAAGDFVAGDLSDDDHEAFLAAVANDDELQSDCRFWEGLRDDLRNNGRDPSAHLPGPGLAVAVRRRLRDDQQTAAKPQRPLQFVPWLLAAAAVVMWLGNYIQDNASTEAVPGLIGFNEDGAAIIDPQSSITGNFRPQQTIAFRPADRAPTATPKPATDARPWLGVLTEPVRLTGLDHQRGGLLVRQVTSGTAAATAGIRPGDVLLDLGGCTVKSRWCISHAISDHLNKDEKFIANWYRPSTQQMMQAPISLGSCWE